jgi:Holliday junction resolvase RusA-like endonuclease
VTPVKKSDVEAGRLENLARRAPNPVETRDAQKAKRSTASNRLRGFHAVTLTIPWKFLVADNAKYGVIRGRMLLRAEYRAAKDTIQHIARRAMLETQMAEGDVTLHAKLYMPDARRRDATNYAKLVQDSLQGAVYADDTQIKVATWEHCGIDRDNPRCEIAVSPRPRSHAA